MGSQPVLLRPVRRVRAIYHLEREEYETINKKNLWSQEIRIRVRSKFWQIVWNIEMSLRASGLARLASYSQHGSDTTCHTPF
jgi:hypothetical protein